MGKEKEERKTLMHEVKKTALPDIWSLDYRQVNPTSQPLPSSPVIEVLTDVLGQ